MPSNVAGYLTAAPTPTPLQDDALENFLGDVVAGVTGMVRSLVRPRWQEEPGTFPARDVTWCAIGVTEQMADAFGYVEVAQDGVSSSLTRHETLTIMASFYGPQSSAFASAFRDGLLIAQNDEQLSTAGFGFVQTNGPTAAPELIKTKWLNRSDITWIARREVRREYPVLSLLSAHGILHTDIGDIPIDVVPLI